MHGRFRNLSPLLYPLPIEASLSKKAPDFLFGFTGNVFYKIIGNPKNHL